MNKLLGFELCDYDFNKLTSISPLGAYLNLIANNIFEGKKNYKKIIEKYYKKVKEYCDSLLSQLKFISYKFHPITTNELNNLTKSDLQNQFDDKMKFIQKIIKNIKENLEQLKKSEKKRIFPEIIDLSEEKEFTEDIYRYFNELGIIFFKLEIKEEEKEEEKEKGDLILFFKQLFKKSVN